MATYWGLHCKPCDSYSGSFLHSAYKKSLRNFPSMAPHIKAIREIEGDSGLMEIRIPYSDDGYEAIDWLVEHAGHDIELQNEYGDREPLAE